MFDIAQGLLSIVILFGGFFGLLIAVYSVVKLWDKLLVPYLRHRGYKVHISGID